MDSNYTKIYTGTSIEVTPIIDKLSAIGIEAVVKDEGESARLAGFATSMLGQVDLYVHNDEVRKAKMVIHQDK